MMPYLPKDQDDLLFLGFLRVAESVTYITSQSPWGVLVMAKRFWTVKNLGLFWCLWQMLIWSSEMHSLCQFFLPFIYSNCISVAWPSFLTITLNPFLKKLPFVFVSSLEVNYYSGYLAFNSMDILLLFQKILESRHLHLHVWTCHRSNMESFCISFWTQILYAFYCKQLNFFERKLSF